MESPNKTWQASELEAINLLKLVVLHQVSEMWKLLKINTHKVVILRQAEKILLIKFSHCLPTYSMFTCSIAVSSTNSYV